MNFGRGPPMPKRAINAHGCQQLQRMKRGRQTFVRVRCGMANTENE